MTEFIYYCVFSFLAIAAINAVIMGIVGFALIYHSIKYQRKK